MPIYEFRCARCGVKTEKLCRLGETGESLSCPSCGRNELKKIFSLIQRKGRPGEDAGGGSSCGSCSSSNCGTCH
ncbi:MAG: zinc ribbon domain-containing protein [Dethiobacter sp.]|jgi:putative FmdB family regulatory protein|nr:zinc ribbon domain-containing protein [Dethiobacter sp.]